MSTVKGTKNWNEFEKNFLKVNWDKLTPEKISIEIKRPMASILTKAKQLNLTRGRLPMNIKHDNEVMERWKKELDE